MNFSSLDLQFIRAWKEIVGSAPADWTPKACADGHSSFLSFSQWWSRAQPPVQQDVFRETLRMLGSNYGRQPTFEAVYRTYRHRAGLSTAGYVAPRVACADCSGTGVVVFPTLKRRDRVYCVDPGRPPPVLRPGEYIGQGSAPCGFCDAGKAVNARWHMPASVVARCNRSRLTQSEHDLWLHGPVREGDAGSRAINESLLHLTPDLASAALQDDDARRQANVAEYAPPAGEPDEERF
jgi:hypothetical protein